MVEQYDNYGGSIMGIRDQIKDMDVNFSSKCRQIEELKMESSRSTRGNNVLSCALLTSREYEQTRRNNNILIFDEKEDNYKLMLENLKDDNSNYVILDFDGVYYKDTADDFRIRGYAVKTIDLTNPERSDGYNPFAYIRNEIDVDLVVQCIIENTNSNFYLRATENEKGIVKGLEQSFLKCLIACYMKYGTSKTMSAAVNLLSGEQRELKLEKLFSGRFEQGPDEKECKRYRIFKQDAGERYSDIIQACYERLSIFKDERLMTLTKKESIDLQYMYYGKGVLYIMIPSSLMQAELITSIVLTQLSYIFTDPSRKNNNDRTIMMCLDYFADAGMIVNLDRMLPEFPQYNVGSFLHINNFSRAGLLYPKWQEIFAACDAIVYLGANDEPTQKYVLDHVDSYVIRKRRVLGKEMYATSTIKMSDIKEMDANDCLVYVKGIGTFITLSCGEWVAE